MGSALWIYVNTENTMYNWMQKHFPLMMKWHHEHIETYGYAYSSNQSGNRMPDDIFATALKCGSQLPALDQVTHVLSRDELDDILIMLLDYNDVFRTAQNRGPLYARELHGITNSYECRSYWTFAQMFQDLWPNHALSKIIKAPVVGRPYIGEDNAYLPDYGVMGYWTYEEAQQILQQISVLHHKKNKNYIETEQWMLDYFEMKVQDEYATENPVKNLKRAREAALNLDGQLTRLKPGEGIITNYSC